VTKRKKKKKNDESRARTPASYFKPKP